MTVEPTATFAPLQLGLAAQTQQSPVSCHVHLRLWDYHRNPDRYQARFQVIQRYDRGWVVILCVLPAAHPHASPAPALVALFG